MSLRAVRTVAGRALALSAAGLVVVVLGLSVVIPRIGGGASYTILTESMRPTMPPGTLVVVRPVKPGEIKVGDVVTYQEQSGEPDVVTHRVQSVRVTLDGSYSFVTKGDANDSADLKPVIPEQIRGVRWYSVRYIGYPSIWVDQDIRQVVVTGAVALLIGYSAMSFAGAARDRRRSRRTAATPDTVGSVEHETAGVRS